MSGKRQKFVHSQSLFICVYLVIDENLHGVVSPLHQHQLIGLSWYCIGEGSSHSGRGVGLNPQTYSQGQHLREAPLGLSIHVVGSQGEGELKLVRGPCVFTC